MDLLRTDRTFKTRDNAMKRIDWTRPASGQTLSLNGTYEILKLRSGYKLLINNQAVGIFPTLGQAKYNAEENRP